MWDNDKAPYLRDYMDVLTSLEFTGCIFVGPARTGKSDVFFNWHGYSAQNDPADMLIYLMTREVAREWSQGDLDKVYRAKRPGTKKSIFDNLIRPGKQNRNVHDVRFMSGMRLLIRWPTITELSGKTIPRLWLADYDRMEQDIAKQGNPFDLARKRATTFKRFGMTVAESSPGYEVTDPNWIATTKHEAPPTKGILELYNRGDRRRWYWKCPHCGEAFEPDFDYLTYDVDQPDVMKASQGVVLTPPCCGADITPDMKYDLNRAGRWLKDGQTWNVDGTITGEGPHTDIASFWMQGPAAAFQDWSSLVLKYLQARRAYEATGDTGPLKTTVNTDQGKPFEVPRDESARLPEELKSRREDWGGAADDPVVPAHVRFLITTIDVQARAFVVHVHGVGPGGDISLVHMFKIRKSDRIDENDARKEHAVIDPAGYPEDWDLLIGQVIERTYPLADRSGRRMAVKMVGCDSGGRAGVTANAYAFWRRLRDDDLNRGHHRRFHLIKGEPSKSAPRRRIGYPDANRTDRHSGARGDVPVEFFNSNLLKDQLYAILGRNTPGGGMIRFPIWAENWVFTQLTAETRTPKGWENESQRRNETWDLLYYVLGLGLHPNIRLEHIDWESPPAWAAEWDKNDLVMSARSANPLIQTQQSTFDLAKIAAEMA
ncbi:MAG: phage terminase large subunit family protein [Devosia sp.]|nr:phage terminase large subunit family protein [Devosia sp.]